MERPALVDAIAFGGSLAAVLVVYALGGSVLGALGAVLRFWFFAAAIAVLLGATLKPKRGGLALAFIGAIACELAVELAFPHLIPLDLGGDSGTCYDRQGAHPC